MIKYFQILKSFIPPGDCNVLEDGVNVIKKMDKSINSSDIRFTLNLDVENKLWFFDSPPTNCYFGLKKRYGRINKYRAQPIDAINVIFQLFRESTLEKYKGSYEKYKLLNCNKNLFFYKDAVNIINDLLPGYFDSEPEVTYEFLGYKEYKYKIIDESFKYTTYKHPPYLSLKVYDNFSTKTCLQKVRWEDLIIPNSNNKGLIFLFCYDKNFDKVGLHISFTFEMSIGKKILELIEKDSQEFKYKMNREWTIDYIASIPLNPNDIKQLAKTIVSYITKEITNKEESYIEII